MTVALVSTPERRRRTDLSELDDAELVRRVLDGNQQAFRQLYDRHNSRLKASARSIVTGADLDDVSQKTWIKIHNKLHTLREPRLFFAWANRIMTNDALGVVRRQNRRTTTDIDDLPPSHQPTDTAPDADERTHWRELVNKTRQWFSKLEDRDRQMFRYFLVDDMTMAEIADKVGMSEGGVKTRLYRARQTLRAHRDAVTGS